jgi:hypothetical protein
MPVIAVLRRHLAVGILHLVQAASGAVARVTGSTIVSEGRGIAAARTGEVGSTVELVGSTVTGRQGGAGVASNSRLSLSDSLLRGDGAGSFGVRMFNGQLDALNSQIIGAEQGILVNADAAVAGQAAINLQNTLVEGQAAAAIVVAGSAAAPASAKINVGNGSRLVGSDGTLLEVRNASSADMTVDNAHLVGNVNVEDGSSATLALNNRSSLTGHLDGVSSLSINDQSTWIMTQDASVGELVLDDGNVQFGQPDAYHRLTVENLSGSGTFVMHADFSTGQTDFLDVTGQATGNHSLLIGSSGKDPEAENQLHVVHAASGDATFSLLNGRVDLGAFSYGLVQRGEDWFLDGSRKVISPGTQSALALFNAAPTVWYGELVSLRSRMGELRLQGGQPGAWVRAYGNKFDVAASSGVAYKQVQQGMSFGADAPLPIGDGQWLVGALAGYSRSDLDLSQGTTGDVDSYYLGLYTTWLDKQSGYYFDGVVKLNRFENDAKVALAERLQVHADFDYSTGEHIDQPWGVNLGLRYSW